ncbi:hypothetical protein BGX30_013910 [Mortierella sp. GBA39]|nr:hypothetical protein BGX30_013910 [Mortierella sp. GBA39]
MTPASMYNEYHETLIQGNPELSKERDTALRLEKARRVIEPSDDHYRRRLAFNIARLSIVEKSVILLDGPALSPASEPTGDDSENPNLHPPAAVSLLAEDCAGFQLGLAFTVGLIPIVGPCISLWLSHNMVRSKLSDLKLSHERQTELQQKMVTTMSQDFLLRLCLPLVGPAVSRYAQPHHAILKHADELVSAHTKQIQQRFDKLVHETLAENGLSLEQWESYSAARVHVAVAAAPPSLAPLAAEWVILDSDEATALEFIEPTVLESADSAAESYIVRVQPGGVHVPNVPVLGDQVGASSAPREQVDIGRVDPDDVASWCSCRYSFSVHRESSILDEATSVAGEDAETQSSSPAVVVGAEQTPHLRIMPVDPIADTAAMGMSSSIDVCTPMNRQIPLIPGHVQDITQTGTLSLTSAIELHNSSPTVAMPPYLEALLAYWPPIQHPVPQLNDGEEETIPTTVLHIRRIIIDIPDMATIAATSTSRSAVPATSSSAVPAPMSSATLGPGLISASTNASEVSDTPQPQVSEDQAFAETDLAFTSQYNTPTPTSDSSILPTSQPDLDPVKVAFSSSSSTLSSPSLSAQEQTAVARSPMTTTTHRPEDLPTRFRDLSIHTLEAGPTRVNSPSASEDDDSPTATIAALATESRTASTSSTSSSTLSATSTLAPRSRPSHLQAPPTFATAGRFQFSSSNEVSSEEEGYGNDFGRDEGDEDDANQEEEDSPGERNQVDATFVDSNHNHQQGAHPQASAVGSEDKGVARDVRDFKIVRPVVRVRPGYRFQNLNHEELFVGFDSVNSRLDDHDRNDRRRRVAGMSEPRERGETQLDSLALRVFDLTTRGPLQARNPDPRSDLKSPWSSPQDADVATLDAAFVKLELSRGPARTQAGELARGGSHVQQDVKQPSMTAEMQGFVGVVGDKAEVEEEEDEQDNGRDVRSVTDQPLNKQQLLSQQHVQPPFQQQSLHVGGTPTYRQCPTATSTGIHSNEIYVPLGSMDTYVTSSEPPTSTTTAFSATNTGTGAGAGEEWSTPPTEQSASLLLCAPFVAKFDDSDDDETPPVVAVRVPNSRTADPKPHGAFSVAESFS